ncbi:Negative regulator of mitotic exit [Balamuthia mandrillaris]
MINEHKLLVFGGSNRSSTVSFISLASTRQVEVVVHFPDKEKHLLDITTASKILLALLQTLRLSAIENYINPTKGQLVVFDAAPGEVIQPGEQREAFFSHTGAPFKLSLQRDQPVKTHVYPHFWLVGVPVQLGCLPGKGHKASDQVIDTLLNNDGQRITNAIPKELGRVTLQTKVLPEIGGSIIHHSPPPSSWYERAFVPPSTGVRGLCLLDESGTHDRFFVYGGYGPYGQVFCWNVEEAQWDHNYRIPEAPSPKAQKRRESSQEQAAPTSGWTPECREGHSMVAIAGRYLWIFGGRDRHYEFLNDLVVFDTRTLTWREVEAKNPPLARAYHTATVWKDKIFVFGGVGKEEEKMLNDVHVFDTKDEDAGWQRLETRGHSIPKPRAHHAASMLHGFMFVTGGKCRGEHSFQSFSDCFALDLQSREWIQIPSPFKDGIFGHDQVVIDESIHIVGGFLDITRRGRNVYNTQTIVLQPNFE